MHKRSRADLFFGCQIEHAYSSEGCLSSFEYASDRCWRTEHSCGKQLLELRPNLYWHASDELQERDLLLLFKAFSGSDTFAREYIKNILDEDWGQEEFQNICSYPRTGRARCLRHIHHIHDNDSPWHFTASRCIHCPLTTLNQGLETTFSDKKQIEE